MRFPRAGARLAFSATSVGEISNALTPLLGESVGRLVFSAGVLGASLVAAIVCSLALAWGVGEVAVYRRSLENSPLRGEMVPQSSAPPPLSGSSRNSLAHDRGPGSKRFPAAAGDRLPRGAGGEGAAGEASSSGALPLGLDRRLGCRHRRESLWWGRGPSVTEIKLRPTRRASLRNSISELRRGGVTSASTPAPFSAPQRSH